MIKELSRIPLAHLPTPIEAMPRLTKTLAGPKLFVKRDDQTGLALGGNKTRKLEYLVSAAQAEGAQTLITAGAIQSNHCRQTAAAAAKAGMECILVLAGEQPDLLTGNTYLDVLLGAELVWTSWEKRDEDLKRSYEAAQREGSKPYLVPYGGSNPVGAAAYAYAIREMMNQKSDVDWIVFPSSSGGTQAGMLVGAVMFDYQGKILGISVDEPEDELVGKVTQLAIETSEYLNHSKKFIDYVKENQVLVNADYLGGGYAVMGDLEKEAIQLFAKQEGLLVDPVYTGRAAGGLIDLIRQGYFKKDENVIFWHTGGIPALFVEKYRKKVL